MSDDEAFPASCCKKLAPDCNTGTPSRGSYHNTGCQARFLTGVYIVGGAGLGVLVIEVSIVDEFYNYCFFNL